MLLDVERIDIAYGAEQVVHGATFSLAEGEIGSLLGPSGCGKTTLLRAIAGFQPVAAGAIHLHGRTVSRPGRLLPPEAREVGMVFQDFALFPHLSVADNIAFGIRRWPAARRRARVAELLALVGLPEHGRLYPHTLSGGQQQRIAVARALAPRPRLLLLDEPFSSMDAELREMLAREVRAILRHEGITGLLVTHDQMEAFAFADRIAVLEVGRILQWDTAYNLYHRPRHRFVAGFVGQGTLLPGRVTADGAVESALGTLRGTLPEGCGPGCPVDLLVRPDDLRLAEEAPLRGEVVERAFRGPTFLYTLRLPGGATLLCQAPSHEEHPIGARVGILPEFAHLALFPRPEEGSE